MKTIFNLVLIFVLAGFASKAHAQDNAPPPMPAGQTFTDAQLKQLVGPIALYPDPLIAVILPAATLPSQIVMADRYISGGGDPNQIDQQAWDPNVQALAHYPAVFKWMDDNSYWTTQLGEAFQNQQRDVMNAFQELRNDAHKLGNLQSTPQQTVIDDNGYIEIIPADSNNIYVPQYQPDQVYYQLPYSVSKFVVFGTPYVIGPGLCGDFDWPAHHLIYWDRDHPRPANWWHEQPQARASYIAAGHARVWNEANRAPGNQVFLAGRGGNNSSAPIALTANNPVPAQSLGNQNDLDLRNSYNNDLPWTSEPEGVTPGPPAPPIEVVGIVDARDVQDSGIEDAGDTQNYDDSDDNGDQIVQTIPEFRNLGGFHYGNRPPARFRGGNRCPAGGFHGGNPPPACAFHGGRDGHGGGDGDSHDGADPHSGGGGGRH